MMEEETRTREQEHASIIKLALSALKDYYGLNPGKNRKVAKGIGNQLGTELSDLIKSSSYDEIINELSSFWKRNGIGDMDWEDKEKGILKIESCSDCLGKAYGAGYTLCPVKEGILEGLLSKKLKKNYSVEEIECCGTLAEKCLFEIKQKD